jgi:hypothetical protein
MISEVCEAFKEADVSDASARKEAISACGSRFADIDLKTEKIDGRLTSVMRQPAVPIGGVAAVRPGVAAFTPHVR